MKNLLSEKKFIIANFLVVIYFTSLHLVNYYEVHHVMVGFFGELLTIPFFITLFIIPFLEIRYLLNTKKYSFLFLLSFILIWITLIIVAKSFF